MKRKNKPKFVQQDYHNYVKVKMRWRKPRGSQSKLRRGKRGCGIKPNIGYGAPAATRNKIKIGDVFFMPVVVKNTKQLDNLTKENVCILSSSLGMRKIADIAKKAKEKNIIILNMKTAKKSLKKEKLIEYNREKRKTDKKKKAEAKKAEEKKKEAKKAEEKSKDTSEPKVQPSRSKAVTPKEDKKPVTKEEPKKEVKKETKTKDTSEAKKTSSDKSREKEAKKDKKKAESKPVAKKEDKKEEKPKKLSEVDSAKQGGGN